MLAADSSLGLRCAEPVDPTVTDASSSCRSPRTGAATTNFPSTTFGVVLVSVGKIRLFVDIDGLQWVIDGDRMALRPTVVVLHGGPGADSSASKKHLGWLRHIAQVVFFDHRANGRSERGEPDTWNLAQWGDDVHALC
jgi:pimeloyl-ACP methyl ester carboxylesterase